MPTGIKVKEQKRQDINERKGTLTKSKPATWQTYRLSVRLWCYATKTETEAYITDMNPTKKQITPQPCR